MKLALCGIVGILVINFSLAPPAARAQQTAKVYRLAIVSPTGSVAEMAEARDPWFKVFFAELRRLGYTEGQNLAVERAAGEGQRERYPEVAREVVRSGPHVILATTGRMALGVRAVTTTIPIVTVTANPIALGLAASLARPGGNVTGFTIDVGFDVPAKRLEILKEAVPKASRIAYLAARPQLEGAWGQSLREAGARAGVALLGVQLREPIGEPEYQRAFLAMARDRADALMVSDHGEGIPHRRLIVDLAAQARLPAIYAHRIYAEAGGLMAYAADMTDISRRAAGYVDRILKGANPADLPFQQPTKFELVVNLKTAKAMSLTLPPPLLVRVDQVIE